MRAMLLIQFISSRIICDFFFILVTHSRNIYVHMLGTASFWRITHDDTALRADRWIRRRILGQCAERIGVRLRTMRRRREICFTVWMRGWAVSCDNHLTNTRVFAPIINSVRSTYITSDINEPSFVVSQIPGFFGISFIFFLFFLICMYLS